MLFLLLCSFWHIANGMDPFLNNPKYGQWPSSSHYEQQPLPDHQSNSGAGQSSNSRHTQLQRFPSPLHTGHDYNELVSENYQASNFSRFPVKTELDELVEKGLQEKKASDEFMSYQQEKSGLYAAQPMGGSSSRYAANEYMQFPHESTYLNPPQSMGRPSATQEKKVMDEFMRYHQEPMGSSSASYSANELMQLPTEPRDELLQYFVEQMDPVISQMQGATDESLDDYAKQMKAIIPKGRKQERQALFKMYYKTLTPYYDPQGIADIFGIHERTIRKWKNNTVKKANSNKKPN